MNVMSLFAGIGGFDLAAEWMGWETKVQVEIDEWCRKVLAKNFPHAKRYADITEFDGTPYRGAIDLVCGGFPCQPYSSAGKRLGTEDERHLWPEMLRVIREVAPRWVVGENVHGLLTWNGGLVLNEVLTDLEAADYTALPPFVLPACGINAPHRRNRVWIIAHAKEIGSNRGAVTRQRCTDGKWTDCARVANDGNNVWPETEPIPQFRGSTRPVSNANQNEPGTLGTVQGGQNAQRGRDSEIIGWDEWTTEPPILRVDDGLPYRLDAPARNARIGAMGNAIVPEVAYQIFKTIQHTESCCN